MPRKHYTCKRSKIARATKAAWNRRKQENTQDVMNTSTQLESSEDVFNRLMEESTTLGRREVYEEKDYQNNTTFSSKSESEAESESKTEELNLLPLEIEHRPTSQDLTIPLNGRRIVDIAHVMKQLENLGNHSKHCTMGKYKYQRESLNGLFATWFYYCDNCDKEFAVTSEPVDQKKEVNDALVWGAMSVGIGYSQLEELFCLLDVPIMNHNKYTKHEVRVGNAWEETLINKMNQNAEEERRVAIEKNHYLNGTPFITVIGDGGWAKRSYGHGMNSLSGVGAIIGAHTQKLLYLGVRNKFCFTCSNPKKKASDHLCFKNYNGPSTGMESDVILEGFRSSEESYGLVYKNYIGDGDSNVMAKIQEGCTYGRYIKKIECANHVTRCLNDHLHKLAQNTKFPLESRQLLIKPAPGETISRLERLVKGVRTAIKAAGVSRSSTDLNNLRQDLKNAPDHVFGNHENCRDFCQRKNNGEENILYKFDTEFLCKIRIHIGNVVSKADSLVFNETTNVAERYMGTVAKFTGGKRVNYTSGGSFKRRCIGAGLSHTVGPSWHLSPWKRLHRSPGEVFKRKILAREQKRSRRKLFPSSKPSVQRRQRRPGKTDKNYGPDAQSPDIDLESLHTKCENFLKKMAEDAAKGSPVEVKTIGQHTNQLWHDQRVNRLTASKFGAVVKRLPHTPCHNMVKSILYPKNLTSEAVCFGRDNEDTVIRMYEEQTANKVNKCGLFVDREHPFLGASPDGLVSSDGLVEVKCLASVKELSFKEEVANKKKDFCLEMKESGELQLKRNHNYFFQVQGQLNIAKRLWCDFVIYSKKGELFVERINKDVTFWQTRMLPKLIQFYKGCILPEIVDSRVVRGMKIRDPQFILDAQEKIARQKEQKSDITKLKRGTTDGTKQKKTKTDIVQ